VRYLALFAAAKSLGLRTIMMNESHAGTERATGWIRLRPAGLRRDKEVDQGRSCQCSVCSFAFGPSSHVTS
jgi:hypothetical protein